MFIDPEWADMSEYVVHFTKPSPDKTTYDNMLRICWTRRIEARNAFGIGRNLAPSPETQKAVCFSEIPLHMLGRLVERRGEYAIGFTKRLLVSRGGGLVFYAYKGTPHLRALRKMMERTAGSQSSKDDAIWEVTPFIEAPGEYGDKHYFFEWEREWRHIGAFCFQPSEVSFLIIPENLHRKARAFFTDAYHENNGPAYLCPYLDAGWSYERVRDTLALASV